MKSKRIGLEVVGNVQASKLVALHCVGLLVSLRDGYMTMEETERFFLPRTVKALRESNIDGEVVTLVELGCELEDVQSLIPERLDGNINSLLAGFSRYLRRCSSSDFIYADVVCHSA